MNRLLTPTAILTVKTIKSLDATLRSGMISGEGLADIATMKKTNIENLIMRELGLTIFPPAKTSKYWNINIPKALRKSKGQNKIYGKTKEELLDKVYIFFFGEDSDSMTIQELYPKADEWYAEMRGWDEKNLTRKRYMYAFLKYIKDTPFGKMPLSKVDSAVYSAFMYSFNDKLIKQELGLISTVTKRIFDYAFYKGYISQNIAYGFNTRGIKKKIPEKKPGFTPEERDKILSVIENSDDTVDMLISLMFFLCSRISEVRGLFIGDIDFEKKTVSIYKEYTDTGLKWHTKPGTEAGVGVFPLVDRALKICRRAIADRTDKEEYLFPTRRHGVYAPISDDAVRDRLSALCDECGIPHKTPHKTRRAGATALAMAGATPDDLKKAGRWTNIQTANRYLDDIQSVERLRTLAEKASA